jgi:hypothetical protein
MTSPMVPAGPEALGLVLGADATIRDGWLVRDLFAPSGLDGPPGVLQGGLSVGATLAAARLADRFGAPPTSVDARLHAPTPLGKTLQAAVRPSADTARYQVETRDGDTLLVSAEVELAGHDVAARVFDLLELGTVALPEPEPQHRFPGCWVCGPEPTHPYGQRIHPRHHRPGEVSQPWVADDHLGDAAGAIDPLVISAVLDCPTVWAAIDRVDAMGLAGPLLGGFHLRFFRDAPVMDALRIVARLDDVDGRKIRARSALVDEDGVTYVTAAALQIAVPAAT